MWRRDRRLRRAALIDRLLAGRPRPGAGGAVHRRAARRDRREAARARRRRDRRRRPARAGRRRRAPPPGRTSCSRPPAARCSPSARPAADPRFGAVDTAEALLPRSRVPFGWRTVSSAIRARRVPSRAERIPSADELIVGLARRGVRTGHADYHHRRSSSSPTTTSSTCRSCRLHARDGGALHRRARRPVATRSGAAPGCSRKGVPEEALRAHPRPLPGSTSAAARRPRRRWRSWPRSSLSARPLRRRPSA